MEGSAYLKRARQHLAQVVAIRRDIHQHPELGFEEHSTAALVADRLRSWGIDVETDVGRLGVVGTIRGRRGGGRAIGLRADMDALAMQEANGFAHVSRHPGRMHACGHDGHTAMLLGAARLLAEQPDFHGVAHLFFQPAEEGRGGAQAMLEDRLLERFPCDRIFGLHSGPGMPVGAFGSRPGAFMAASGRWRVRFSGSGGHGGMTPHLASDLTVAQAGFVQGLQAIVARDVPPSETAIISVGSIQGGNPEAMNVMPAELTLCGTMRAFTPSIQALLEARMAALAQAHADLAGAQAQVQTWWVSVPVRNDAQAFQDAIQAAGKVAGDASVDAQMPPMTAGEDFSWMLARCPGTFMFLGNGDRQGDGGGHLHMPNYDFNDDALPYGIAYWLALVDGMQGP